MVWSGISRLSWFQWPLKSQTFSLSSQMHLFLSCPLCFPLVMYVLNLFVVDVLLSLWLLLSLYWTRALFIFYFCFAYPHSWSCPRSCSSLLSCLPLALVLLVLTLVLIVLFYCLDCYLVLIVISSCLDCTLVLIVPTFPWLSLLLSCLS